MPEDYLEKLNESYFSKHYERIMPQTRKAWEWVLQRVEINFGDIVASLPKNGKILDVPCGVGYFEEYLLRKGFTNIHAIDLSEEQIQVAKRKLLDQKVDYKEKVKFEVCDAFNKLREVDGYEAIIVIDFLEHLSKAKILEFLALTHRALKPEGFLIIRTINAENPLFGKNFYSDFTHETPFTRASLRQCLEVSDFDVFRLTFEQMPPYAMGRSISNATQSIKQRIRSLGLRVFAKFLAVPPNTFVGDVVAVAQKPK